MPSKRNQPRPTARPKVPLAYRVHMAYNPSSPPETVLKSLPMGTHDFLRVLGALLALIAVLGVELLDRRVRGPFDLVDALELPVIGVLPSTQSKYHPRLPWLKKNRRTSSFNAISTNVKRVETA